MKRLVVFCLLLVLSLFSMLFVSAVTPTVDIKANGLDGPISIASGASAKIDWVASPSTSSSLSCTGRGGMGIWPGGRSLLGTATFNPTSSMTFSITCTDSLTGASASDSVVVNVNAGGSNTNPPNSTTSCTQGTSNFMEIQEGSSGVILAIYVQVVSAEETNTRLSANVIVGGTNLYLASDSITAATVYILGNPYTAELISTSDTSATIRITCGTKSGSSPTSCTDSDGGNVLDVKGIVTDSTKRQYTDSCVTGENSVELVSSSEEIIEYICQTSPGANGLVGSNRVTCPNGCLDGACLSAGGNPTCTDSDGGINYGVKGTFTVKTGTDVESCLSEKDALGLRRKVQSGSDLEEMYCENNLLKSEIVNCPGGCLEGACKSLQGGGQIPPMKNIDSCAEIKEPGNYRLEKDLIGSPDFDNAFYKCLNIHDANNVHINCQGHSITAGLPVSVERVDGFSLEFCNITAFSYGELFNIFNSKNGRINKNNITGYVVSVVNTSNIIVTNNNFNSIWNQERSSGNSIENNNFNPLGVSPKLIAGVIVLNFGKNNKIMGNTINGTSDGIFSQNFADVKGADDGIILQDESGDLVERNYIENNWDCGIETVGFVSNTKIINNKIENSGLCGIGGWYWNGWKSNEVSGNLISDTKKMFWFFRAYGLRSEDTYVYFEDNTFRNNKFINEREEDSSYSSFFNIQDFGDLSTVPNERPISSSDIKLGNNTFENNDFGVLLKAPFFLPESMVVDGGGNICSKPENNDYPLKCNYGIMTNLIDFFRNLLGLD